MRPLLPTSAAIAATLFLAAAAAAQDPSPYERIQALGLDSMRVDPVLILYDEADRARAAELASLVRDANEYFRHELELALEPRIAGLPAGHWVGDIPTDRYTMPYGIEAERMIVVPASGARLPEGAPFTRPIDFIALHEYGHLANTRYFRAGQWDAYAPTWFEEFLATYWAWAYVRRFQPAWSDSLLREWPATLTKYTPPELSLDWRFMRSLPPEEMSRSYGWYQIMLNVEVARVYEEQGVGFLRAVRERLDWDVVDSWTTPALLARLEKIAPGFQEWADRLRAGDLTWSGGPKGR